MLWKCLGEKHILPHVTDLDELKLGKVMISRLERKIFKYSFIQIKEYAEKSILLNARGEPRPPPSAAPPPPPTTVVKTIKGGGTVVVKPEVIIPEREDDDEEPPVSSSPPKGSTATIKKKPATGGKAGAAAESADDKKKDTKGKVKHFSFFLNYKNILTVWCDLLLIVSLKMLRTVFHLLFSVGNCTSIWQNTSG